MISIERNGNLIIVKYKSKWCVTIDKEKQHIKIDLIYKKKICRFSFEECSHISWKHLGYNQCLFITLKDGSIISFGAVVNIEDLYEVAQILASSTGAEITNKVQVEKKIVLEKRLYRVITVVSIICIFYSLYIVVSEIFR